MMAARNAIANHFNDLFKSVFTSHARKRNATNRIPWAQPKTVTAIGCLKRYFSGIAMPNNTKKEIPSAIPVLRSHDNFLFILSYYTLKSKAASYQMLSVKLYLIKVKSQIEHKPQSRFPGSEYLQSSYAH